MAEKVIAKLNVLNTDYEIKDELLTAEVTLLKQELATLKSNIIPLDFVYVQFPGMKTPNELWGSFGYTFEEVTDYNDGSFFRCKGGNALEFNAGLQEDEIKSHSHTAYCDTADTSHDHSENNYCTGKNSSHGKAGSTKNHVENYASGSLRTGWCDQSHSHKIEIGETGDKETRPRNRTIQIWKRIG